MIVSVPGGQKSITAQFKAGCVKPFRLTSHSMTKIIYTGLFPLATVDGQKVYVGSAFSLLIAAFINVLLHLCLLGTLLGTGDEEIICNLVPDCKVFVT